MKPNNHTLNEGHPVVSHRGRLSARVSGLTREEEFSQQQDELNQHHRSLPRELVEKQYTFDGRRGRNRWLILVPLYR